jgi:hypothetical protein
MASSGNSTQLGDTTDFHPLDHENVAGVIEACAVRRNELSCLERIP